MHMRHEGILIKYEVTILSNVIIYIIIVILIVANIKMCSQLKWHRVYCTINNYN